VLLEVVGDAAAQARVPVLLEVVMGDAAAQAGMPVLLEAAQTETEEI
jgi:hypothetical protein